MTTLVTAGLDPAIHDFLCSKNADARDKPGHDGKTYSEAARRQNGHLHGLASLMSNFSSAPEMTKSL